jgi:uncharacterized membrane protein YqjE
MLIDNNRQKSPARRFLLILGIAAFICFSALGLLIIFWDAMLPTFPKVQKIAFGCIIIIYAAVRFSRLLKRSRDEG